MGAVLLVEAAVLLEVVVENFLVGAVGKFHPEAVAETLLEETAGKNLAGALVRTPIFLRSN